MEVSEFLNQFKSHPNYEDYFTIFSLMTSLTGKAPRLWKHQIIGFGTYTYINKTTRGEWFLTGFSPRKNNISIYIMTAFENHKSLMQKLGKYKTGKSCLYIKRLSDIDLDILKALISESLKLKIS